MTGSGLLMRKLPGCRSAIAAASGAEAAVQLKDGERIEFGTRFVECRATPGAGICIATARVAACRRRDEATDRRNVLPCPIASHTQGTRTAA